MKRYKVNKVGNMSTITFFTLVCKKTFFAYCTMYNVARISWKSKKRLELISLNNYFIEKYWDKYTVTK